MPLQRVMGHILDKAYTDEDDFRLGAEVEDEQGRVFAFVKYQKLGSSEGAEGLFGVACDTAYDHGYVTCDSNHADAVETIPEGQFQAQLDDGELGWVQKRGWNRKAITSDGNVDHSEELMVSGSTRGILIPKTALINSVGAAAADDSDSTLAVGSVFLKIA